MSFNFQFGNYGSRLAVKLNGVMSVLSLENWAYGETTGIISAYGLTSEQLAHLGKELIQASLKLEEKEKAK